MSKFIYSIQYADKKGYHTEKAPPRQTDPNEKYIDTFYRIHSNDSADLFIWSIGHQVTWPERKLMHRVSTAAILHYVVNGKGTFNDQPVHSGQFFFSMPYLEYSIVQDPDDPMEYYWCSFAGHKTRELLKECKLDHLVTVGDIDFMDQIVALFDKAIYENHDKYDIDMYLVGLAYQLLSYHKQMNLLSESLENTQKDYLYFKKAVTFIDKNFARGITVNDVAEHLHISPSYCRLIFHKYCPDSPQKMIQLKRFDQARRYLKLTTFSVKEIASRVGYQDQSLFSRQFKKMIGLSPLEYRDNRNKTEMINK